MRPKGLPSLGALLFVLLCLQRPLQSATLRANLWQPNGPVEALLLNGSTLYVAGSFTALTSPGGLSTVARANLAAIDWTSGAPLAWDPGVNGAVHAMALQGTKLYIGGSFSTAGGLSASNLASLNTGSNTGNAWAGANGAVHSLAVQGLSVFVGGDFSTVAGVTRSALAEVNGNSPTVTAFDAQLSGTAMSVRALALSGSLLYAGGSFSGAGAAPRQSIAAFSKTSGLLNAWNPSASFVSAPWVYSLFALNGSLWVGGDFSGAWGGGAANHLVALDLASATATWAPTGTDSAVLALVPDSAGRVHAGGQFANAGGSARVRYASYFQAVAALEPSFSADLNGGASEVRALLVNGSEMALGGQFTQVDGQSAKNLAIVTLPALGAVPTATSTVVVTSNASGAAVGAAYVYPQPGPCARLSVAVPFPSAGTARLRFMSVRGSVVGTAELSATGAGTRTASLDCGAWEPGLFWMECSLDLADGSQRKLPLARFIVQEP